MKMRLDLAGLAILTVSFACVPRSARAGVYDSVAAWWHFDYDPNANGLADLDDIRDQRYWGSAAAKGAGGNHAASVTGMRGSPQWTNSTAVCPAGGFDYGRRAMLFDPAVDANGQVWPDTFRVSGLGLAGSATLVTRFRWGGPTAPGTVSYWLYNNHLEWNAYRGWLFGISTNASGGHLSFYTQRASTTMDVTVTNGVWYDVGMVLTDYGTNQAGTVEFYLWPETCPLVYRKYTNTGITNSINPAPLTTVGSENHSNNYGTGNNIKSFKGEVNHLAVWNRALSFAEMHEALGHPRPNFRIGVNNNSPFDMRLESEVDADYRPGDPWHTMRRAVTAGFREATLHLPLTDAQRRLPYVVHVDTGTDGQTGGLGLVVNGYTNETQAAANGGQLYWYVTTNLLVTGTNTVTLYYASGPAAYISFDWLEMDGSWQVGYEDNNQAEFINETSAPDDYFVSNPNWTHLERAITSGDTNVMVHFTLSSELAAKYRFRYTTRIIAQGPSMTNHAFSAEFNGVTLRSYAPVPNGTYVSLPLDRALLRSGDNVMKFRYDETPAIGGYLQFDFHRLEILEQPKGTLIVLH